MPIDKRNDPVPENTPSNEEPAEGSRENAGGITNRPLGEEQRNQQRVPPRGHAKEDRHA